MQLAKAIAKAIPLPTSRLKAAINRNRLYDFTGICQQVMILDQGPTVKFWGLPMQSLQAWHHVKYDGDSIELVLLGRPKSDMDKVYLEPFSGTILCPVSIPHYGNQVIALHNDGKVDENFTIWALLAMIYRRVPPH
jgi:hypothetical protein